jgi:hypothetical protein
MTTRRGRKNEALLLPSNVAAVGTTYVATRPIPVGDLMVPAGVEIPFSELGPRPEAWVRARRLRLVPPGEDFTSLDQFRETVERAIDEAEQLLVQHREKDAAPEE